MRTRARRCAEVKPQRHERREEYIDVICPWKLLSFILFLVGLVTFWSALYVGLFVSLPIGVLGLFGFAGCLIFAANAFEQGE
jgi:hypothetical protein